MVSKTIRIRGPLVPGNKVCKENSRGALTGDVRFFNPDGGTFEVEVANDPFYVRMTLDGTVELVKPAATPAKPGKDK